MYFFSSLICLLGEKIIHFITDRTPNRLNASKTNTQQRDADAHLPAGRPSGHADDERPPVCAPIAGSVTWLCLAVGQHASSAARCGSLTHGGAALLPFDAAVDANDADERLAVEEKHDEMRRKSIHAAL